MWWNLLASLFSIQMPDWFHSFWFFGEPEFPAKPDSLIDE